MAENEIAALEKTVADHPDSAEALTDLALAYSDAGRIDEAAEALRRACALAPADIEILLGLASLEHVLGHGDAVEAAIHKALDLDPDNPNVYRIIHQTSARPEQVVDRIVGAARYVELQPDAADRAQYQAEVERLLAELAESGARLADSSDEPARQAVAEYLAETLLVLPYVRQAIPPEELSPLEMALRRARAQLEGSYALRALPDEPVAAALARRAALPHAETALEELGELEDLGASGDPLSSLRASLQQWRVDTEGIVDRLGLTDETEPIFARLETANAALLASDHERGLQLYQEALVQLQELGDDRTGPLAGPAAIAYNGLAQCLAALAPSNPTERIEHLQIALEAANEAAEREPGMKQRYRTAILAELSELRAAPSTEEPPTPPAGQEPAPLPMGVEEPEEVPPADEETLRPAPEASGEPDEGEPAELEQAVEAAEASTVADTELVPAEPEPEAEAKAAAEPEPEAAAETEPEPDAETTAGPEPDAEAVAEPVPTVDEAVEQQVGPAAVATAEPEPAHEAEVEDEPEPVLESAADESAVEPERVLGAAPAAPQAATPTIARHVPEAEQVAALFAEAQTAMDAGNLREARARFETARDTAQDRSLKALAHAGLAAVYHAAGEKGAALEAIEAATGLDAACVEAYLVRAEIAEEDKEWNQALEAYQFAEAADPDDPRIQRGLGLTLCELDQFSAAIDSLTKALAGAPEDPLLCYKMGEAFLGVGQRAQAKACFEEALNLGLEAPASDEVRAWLEQETTRAARPRPAPRPAEPAPEEEDYDPDTAAPEVKRPQLETNADVRDRVLRRAAAEVSYNPALHERCRICRYPNPKGAIRCERCGHSFHFVEERRGAARGGPCFIATAACGHFEAPEVRILRQYRDERLLPHAFGRQLVRLYYLVSPPLARWIYPRPTVREAVRRHLIRPLARATARRLKKATRP